MPIVQTLFSEPPHELLFPIYERLPTANLFAMTGVSNQHRVIALMVLFKRYNDEALAFQVNLMISWVTNAYELNLLKKTLLSYDELKKWVGIFKQLYTRPHASIECRVLCVEMMILLGASNAELLANSQREIISFIDKKYSLNDFCNIIPLDTKIRRTIFILLKYLPDNKAVQYVHDWMKNEESISNVDYPAFLYAIRFFSEYILENELEQLFVIYKRKSARICSDAVEEGFIKLFVSLINRAVDDKVKLIVERLCESTGVKSYGPALIFVKLMSECDFKKVASFCMDLVQILISLMTCKNSIICLKATQVVARYMIYVPERDLEYVAKLILETIFHYSKLCHLEGYGGNQGSKFTRNVTALLNDIVNNLSLQLYAKFIERLSSESDEHGKFIFDRSSFIGKIHHIDYLTQSQLKMLVDLIIDYFVKIDDPYWDKAKGLLINLGLSCDKEISHYILDKVLGFISDCRYSPFYLFMVQIVTGLQKMLRPDHLIKLQALIDMFVSDKRIDRYQVVDLNYSMVDKLVKIPGLEVKIKDAEDMYSYCHTQLCSILTNIQDHPSTKIDTVELWLSHIKNLISFVGSVNYSELVLLLTGVNIQLCESFRSSIGLCLNILAPYCNDDDIYRIIDFKLAAIKLETMSVKIPVGYYICGQFSDICLLLRSCNNPSLYTYLLLRVKKEFDSGKSRLPYPLFILPYVPQAEQISFIENEIDKDICLTSSWIHFSLALVYMKSRFSVEINQRFLKLFAHALEITNFSNDLVFEIEGSSYNCHKVTIERVLEFVKAESNNVSVDSARLLLFILKRHKEYRLQILKILTDYPAPVLIEIFPQLLNIFFDKLLLPYSEPVLASFVKLFDRVHSHLGSEIKIRLFNKLIESECISSKNQSVNDFVFDLYICVASDLGPELSEKFYNIFGDYFKARPLTKKSCIALVYLYENLSEKCREKYYHAYIDNDSDVMFKVAEMIASCIDELSHLLAKNDYFHITYIADVCYSDRSKDNLNPETWIKLRQLFNFNEISYTDVIDYSDAKESSKPNQLPCLKF